MTANGRNSLRLIAKAEGKTRFSTGEPCFRGHVSERLTSNGACATCEYERKSALAKTEEGRAANREYHARHRQRNPNYWRLRSNEVRQWKEDNKDRYSESKRKYDWKRDGLPTPTRPSPTSCEACGRSAEANGRALALDHCHETGAFRGWLCDKCNRGIGMLGDQLAGVKAALDYLMRAAGETNNREKIP